MPRSGPHTPPPPQGGGQQFGGWHPGPGGPLTPGPGTPYTNPGPGKPPAMTAEQQSAFAVLMATLEQYGLGSLSETLKNMILQGLDKDTIWLQLQQTNEWKQRFAGNEMLAQQGLGILSPAEYLALERSYAQIMHNYGLPSGFYDDPSDFAKWIGNNVSAAELQQRVAGFADLMNRSEDPTIKQQLSSMGLGEGDLLAMWMDPTRATPLIQQKYQTALLGAASRRAGFVANNDYLGQLAARGVSEEQASQGFGLVAANLDTAQTLSNVYGVQYGADDLQAEIFDNSGSAQKKRKRLASQERASFSGSAGTGSLTQNTAGSY